MLIGNTGMAEEVHTNLSINLKFLFFFFILSEVSQKDKDYYNILTHIYGI